MCDVYENIPAGALRNEAVPSTVGECGSAYESYQPSQDVPTPAKTRPMRNFSTLETVFAWICFVFGYLFCRVFPAVVHPMGGFIFICCAFLIIFAVIKAKKVKFGLRQYVSAVTGTVTSAGLILSANATVQYFSYLYALVMLMYVIYSALGNGVKRGEASYIAADFLKLLFIMPFFSIGCIFKAAFSGRARKGGRFVLKLIIGIGIAIVPLVTVLLLLSYDLAFTTLLKDIFSFDIADILGHIISIIFGVPVGMYIFGLFISSADKKCENMLTADSCDKVSQVLRVAPAVTVFAAVVPVLLVYVIFFISQWPYYVSGFTGVLPQEFSYAEYAREGFFQLCTVAFINFVIISAVTLLMKRKAGGKNIPVRLLCVTIALFTLALISTAAAKLIMYINYYGLTPKRVYSGWFILLLAAVFAVILIKQFAFKLKAVPIALSICVIMFSALSLSGVDSVIARYNADRYISGSLETLDVGAMYELGDAAVPELVRVAQILDEKNGSDISRVVPYELEYGDTYSQIAAVLYNRAAKEQSGVFSMTVPTIKANQALTQANITPYDKTAYLFYDFVITDVADSSFYY